VIEPRSARGEAQSHLYCLPARFGWSDLGSWGALHEYQTERKGADEQGNVVEATGNIEVNAHNNYVYSPGRYVALVGVEDLVVVETEDALLITSRHHSQDVGKVVKELAARGHEELI
jgi:mannose-1-phosphate guanylyltransferase